MKSWMKFLFLLSTIFIFINPAYAETPREQLKQMVGQLQKSPNDNALREQIIKLARTVKPVIPEEAERRMVRGTAAFKGAKSVADYRDAAKEFEQATLAAPWYGDAYLNLGVAQDKAENYDAALRSLNFALLASPNDKEVKALMYEVEYRNEKAHSPEVMAVQQATLQREKDEALLRSLDGSRYIKRDDFIETYVVRGNTLIVYWRLSGQGQVMQHSTYGRMTSEADTEVSREQWSDGGFTRMEDASSRDFYVLSPDGSKLIEREVDKKTGKVTYEREAARRF